MRITQKYTDRTYLKYNNRLLENYTNSMEKIWRQKAFKRASEDSINASKAMIVRRNLRDLDTYDRNLNAANDVFKAAESNLYTLCGDVYNNVMVKMETACNGTYDEPIDRVILGTEIGEYADSALNTLNKDYAERIMFGGTNNSEPPFAKYHYEDPVTGETKYGDPVTGRTLVTYNGVIINDMVSDKTYLERIEKDDFYAANPTYPSEGSTTNTVIRKAYDNKYSDEITKAKYDTMSAAVATGGAITAANDPEAVYKERKTTESNESLITAYEPVKGETSQTLYVCDKRTNEYYKYTVTRSDISYSDWSNLATQAEKDAYKPCEFDSNGLPTAYYKVECSAKQTSDETEYLNARKGDDVCFSIDGDGSCQMTETKYYEKKFVYYNATPKEVPGTKPIYVDIGIGIKYDENYAVDPQTAMDVSFNGAAVTGFGTSSDGEYTYSKNFIQQIYDAAAALKEGGGVPFTNATLDRLNDARTIILTEITTLGSKQNSVEFYLEKNDDYRYSLKERQNDVEGCDMEEEITNMDAVNAAYQAILKMSANVLPQSIFDFVR